MHLDRVPTSSLPPDALNAAWLVLSLAGASSGILQPLPKGEDSLEDVDGSLQAPEESQASKEGMGDKEADDESEAAEMYRMEVAVVDADASLQRHQQAVTKATL